MIDLEETKEWLTHPDTIRYAPASAVQRVQDLARECEKLRQDHKAMIAVQNITARECANIAEEQLTCVSIYPTASEAKAATEAKRDIVVAICEKFNIPWVF